MGNLFRSYWKYDIVTNILFHFQIGLRYAEKQLIINDNTSQHYHRQQGRYVLGNQSMN